ncbi:unnamed protein product [Tenebrio molitor]|jgi:hypothetical protein|nr:unnamed protein product [Tenebrio molitor]
MESNNRVPVTGLPYLWSYAGGLNILEEFLNITVIIFMALSGPSMQANFLIGMSVLSAIHTAVFVFLHIQGIIRKSTLPWHWIECVSVLVVALLVVIFSSIVLLVFTKGYIVTAIMGYLTSMVYFVDIFHKYQIAVAPIPKYAWTTPNMPDLG